MLIFVSRSINGERIGRAAQGRHATKRRHLEGSKRTQDSLYPPHRFIAANPESDCAADVRGSVILPDSLSSVCVEGYVLLMARVLF